MTLVACTPASDSAANLPAGDASRGAQLFTQSVNGAPSCSTCHTLDGSSGTGPSLQGISKRAGSQVANLSAKDYLYQSITRPSAFIVSGFSNVMYDQYAQRLTPQQTAD